VLLCLSANAVQNISVSLPTSGNPVSAQRLTCGQPGSDLMAESIVSIAFWT
jgi:hypothetical protein